MRLSPEGAACQKVQESKKRDPKHLVERKKSGQEATESGNEGDTPPKGRAPVSETHYEPSLGLQLPRDRRPDQKERERSDHDTALQDSHPGPRGHCRWDER